MRQSVTALRRSNTVRQKREATLAPASFTRCLVIHVACPQCTAALKAPDGTAGKTLACPKCKAAVTVPSLTIPVCDPDSLTAPPLTAPINSIAVTAPRNVRFRSAHRARILSFENLPYIRLPKAPIAWEERYRSQSEPILNAASVGTTDTDAKAPRSNLPRFNVSGNGWAMGSEDTLPPNSTRPSFQAGCSLQRARHSGLIPRDDTQGFHRHPQSP